MHKMYMYFHADLSKCPVQKMTNNEGIL